MENPLSEKPGAMHDADIRQISDLVQALERSGFDSLQIETAEIKLVLSKGVTNTVAPHAPAKAAARDNAAKSIPTAPSNTIAEKLPSPAATITAAAELSAVKSPIMGQFYRAPDPSSPAFVEIGTQVDETTTVGLIEVMKVFNAVAAGTKGTIAEICVEDGQTIDIGQVLFRVRTN